MNSFQMRQKGYEHQFGIRRSPSGSPLVATSCLDYGRPTGLD
jgi:hypothetical protein